MALPKNAIFGAELFSLNKDARQAIGEAVRDPAAEIAYLTYGGLILARLREATAPISDRKLYDAIRGDAQLKPGSYSFAQFRQALDGMVAKGLVLQAGKDPEFGDPLYALNQTS